MEAHGLISRFRTNSAILSSQTRHEPLFLISNPSIRSFVQVQKHICFQTQAAQCVKGSSKIVQCVNTTKESVTFVFDKEDHKKAEVKRKKLAVFVSGGGSNFKSIHEACVEGSVHGDIIVLVTNKHSCGGAEYARNNEIPVILFPRTKDERGLSPSDLVATLRRFEVDFVLLAGYLKLIPVELIHTFPQSILNIHPSLLPAFGGKGYYGMKVHKAVIASGARYSGPTIHFVDEHYDTGRILAQRVVPVLANDTAESLAARVLQEEHRLYVDVTMALCDERIIWREDGVPLIQSCIMSKSMTYMRKFNNSILEMYFKTEDGDRFAHMFKAFHDR